VSWKKMLALCRNPKDPGYTRYGGQGIAVCGRWTDSRLFYEDMGERPDGKFLGRIDKGGDYAPETAAG
jgi:hypothetical protein